jgi:hypothetical protein
MGLSHVWWTGARLYRTLGRLDAHHGVSSWEEALTWLAEHEPDRPIAEIQYWGHGKWGAARIGTESFDHHALYDNAPLGPLLDRVRARMLPDGRSLWWFRTCETFGARRGHCFAETLADRMQCSVAGHTFIIGHWQSGLHTLQPGAKPDWAEDEGLIEGTPDDPKKARWSKASLPNTVSFLTGRIPDGY